MSIFRAYDIRGIYPEELTEEIAERIGYAFALYLQEQKAPLEILIGRDIRNGSDVLMDAFAHGAARIANVHVLGICTTPSLAILTAQQKYGGGVMVTASHNPKEFNGFKFCGKGGRPIGYNTGLDRIEMLYTQITKLPDSYKSIVPQPILDEYTETLFKFLRMEELNKFAVILDPGNSVASVTAGALFKKLQIPFSTIHVALDGNFPERSPNPLDGVAGLQQAVLRNRAAAGFAFDGDADRLIVVDETGRVLDSALVAQILIHHYLDIRRYGKVVLDVRLSKAVAEYVYEQHGDVILSKTGHVNIKNAMMQHNASVGAELSGHYYHKQLYYADDAVYTALIILLVMNRENKPLSQIVRQYKNYHHIHTDLPVSNRQEALLKIRSVFSDARMDFMDGIKIEYPDWWAVIRPSNTEEKIRVTVESQNKETAEKKYAEIKELLTV